MSGGFSVDTCLSGLRRCLDEVAAQGVPGDLREAGGPNRRISIRGGGGGRSGRALPMGAGPAGGPAGVPVGVLPWPAGVPVGVPPVAAGVPPWPPGVPPPVPAAAGAAPGFAAAVPLRAVFLDRDGVLTVPPPQGCYVRSAEEVRLLPGVPRALADLRRAGFRLIVATNQRGVALGLVGLPELRRIHRRIQQRLRAAGAELDAFVFCPHGLDARCACRKPKPGMLLAAAPRAGVELAASYMIGDGPRDIEAGRRAGCRTVYVGRPPAPAADLVCRDLPAAAAAIVARAGPIRGAAPA